MGALHSEACFYQCFRELLQADIVTSARLTSTGLGDIARDMIAYTFFSSARAPPSAITEFCWQLVSSDSSLILKESFTAVGERYT